MFLHDAVADAEAETGSLPDFLGGEEGVEDFVGVDDAVAVVDEGNFDGIAGTSRGDLDASGASDFVNRIVSVIQNVEKDLLQLVGVSHYFGKALVEMFDHFHAVAGEI